MVFGTTSVSRLQRYHSASRVALAMSPEDNLLDTSARPCGPGHCGIDSGMIKNTPDNLMGSLVPTAPESYVILI